jgi:ribosomal protein S18 acetylase RimI-like enzyme
MAVISSLSNADKPVAIATVVAAFATDPVERWLWPEADAYAASFPEFVAAFGGDSALGHQTAWGARDASAVALWLAPGVEPVEEAIVGVLTESVSVQKHNDLFSILEQMAAIHPRDPHWYLPWLAVAPALQGRGLGGHLLEHSLGIVDADKLPAFLETPNPRTIPLYESHGFELVGTAQAGSCPPMTSMLRPAA